MALFIVMKFWLVSFFVSCLSTRYVQLHCLALDGPYITISRVFAISVRVSMDVYMVKMLKTKHKINNNNNNVQFSPCRLSQHCFAVLYPNLDASATNHV